jgi:hypothetical protein
MRTKPTPTLVPFTTLIGATIMEYRGKMISSRPDCGTPFTIYRTGTTGRYIYAHQDEQTLEEILDTIDNIVEEEGYADEEFIMPAWRSKDLLGQQALRKQLIENIRGAATVIVKAEEVMAAQERMASVMDREEENELTQLEQELVAPLADVGIELTAGNEARMTIAGNKEKMIEEDRIVLQHRLRLVTESMEDFEGCSTPMARQIWQEFAINIHSTCRQMLARINSL